MRTYIRRVLVLSALCFALLPQHPFAATAYYSFQLGSFPDKEAAVLMYERIKDLPKARVEKIGEYYTVRIGFWKSRQTAEAFRGVTRRIAPDAFLRIADLKQERILIQSSHSEQRHKDLEQKNKAAEEKLARVETSVEELKAQEQELRATIESQKVRAILVAVFGELDSSVLYANVLEKYQMIKAKNYHDTNLNPEGKSIDHQFQSQPGDSIILDAATELTWQQSGSSRDVLYLRVEEYIQKINAETFGGYSDWRLPTLEESMSLMESKKKNGRYISGQFDKSQPRIWTSDKIIDLIVWVVDFDYGSCAYVPATYSYYVRAVRKGDKLNVSK